MYNCVFGYIKGTAPKTQAKNHRHQTNGQKFIIRKYCLNNAVGGLPMGQMVQFPHFLHE